MYLRWIRHAVRGTSRLRYDVLCFHSGPGRYALSPQVIESYRGPSGAVHKRLVWAPGSSIRTCCAADKQDPISRVLWWLEVSERVEQLQSISAWEITAEQQRLLDQLPALLDAMARTVPMPSSAESEFVEAWSERTARLEHETLRAWYERCWTETQEAMKTRVPDPTRITRSEALALFGLSATYTSEELKQAYRKAAFAAHPDREGGSHAQFLRVGAAYELLR